mgnify:CR=1 FL=1
MHCGTEIAALPQHRLWGIISPDSPGRRQVTGMLRTCNATSPRRPGRSPVSYTHLKLPTSYPVSICGVADSIKNNQTTPTITHHYLTPPTTHHNKRTDRRMTEQLLSLAVWMQIGYGELCTRGKKAWTERHDESGIDEAVTKMLWLAVGIVVAAGYALVVLPAVLVLFGRWVFWPVVPRVGQTALVDQNSFWRKVGAERLPPPRCCGRCDASCRDRASRGAPAARCH